MRLHKKICSVLVASVMLTGNISLFPVSAQESKWVNQDIYNPEQNLLLGAEDFTEFGVCKEGEVLRAPDPDSMKKNVFDGDDTTGWFGGENFNPKDEYSVVVPVSITFPEPTVVDTVEYLVNRETGIRYVHFGGVRADTGEKVQLAGWDNKDADSRNQMANNMDRNSIEFTPVALTKLEIQFTMGPGNYVDNVPLNFTLYEVKAYHKQGAVHTIDGEEKLTSSNNEQKIQYTALNGSYEQIPEPDAVYELDREVEGVSIDEKTGILTVEKNAKQSVFNVKASTNKGKESERTVIKKVVLENPNVSEQEQTELAKEWLTFDTISPDSIDAVTHNLTLYRSGPYNSQITWSSSDEDTLDTSGRVNRGLPLDGDKKVQLNANIRCGQSTQDISFDVTVAAYEQLQDTAQFTDEDMFGVWNGTTWTKEGIFNYEYDDEMAAIGETVKNGDYEAAKEMYLQYTKKKAENLKISKPSSSPLKSDMAINDIATPNAPLAIISVPSEEGWVETPVSVTPGNTMSYLLTSYVKDGTVAEFNSRENTEIDEKTKLPKMPLLEVTLKDGTKKIFTPTCDTYVRGGRYSWDNFGDEPILAVSESLDENLWGDDMREAMFEFNTAGEDYYGESGLSKTDEIAGARLMLYGKNSSNTGEKDVVLWTVNAIRAVRGLVGNTEIADEYRINLRNYPTPILSYRGLESGIRWGNPNNVIDEFHWQILFRFYFIGNMPGDYSATGDERYAYHSLRHIMDFMNQVGHNGQGNREFEPTFRVGTLLQNMKYVNNSPYYTAEANTSVVKSLYCIGRALSNRRYFNGSFNMGGSQLNAFISIMGAFKEFREFESWEDTAKYYMDRLFGEQNQSGGLGMQDGAYVESTNGYAFATIKGLHDTFVNARDMGIEMDDRYLEQLKQLAYYELCITTPDGIEVKFGDGGGKHVIRNEGDFEAKAGMSQIAKTLGDDSLFDLLIYNNLENPPFTSKLFDYTGRMTMRSGWGKQDTFAYMNFDGGLSHGHYDDNSLSISAYGSNLIVDNPGGNYDGTGGRAFKLSSLGHNTLGQVITADGERYLQQMTRVDSFARTKATINRWFTSNPFDFISVTLPDDTYAVTEFNEKNEPSQYGERKGISYTRNLLFVRPGYFIVSDYALDKEGNKNSTYELRWNFEQNHKTEIDSETKTAQTNYANSANIQIVNADPENINVEMADSIYGNGTVGDEKALSVSKVSDTDRVSFDTVLFPVKEGDKESNASIQRLPIENTESTEATALEITINSGDTVQKDSYYYAHETKADRSFGDFATNGRLAYISGDGQSLILTEGTYLAEQGKKLVEMNDEIKSLSIEKSNGIMNIYTEDKLDAMKLNDALIYSEEPVSQVFVNGEEVKFARNGDLISVEIPEIVFEDTDGHWAEEAITEFVGLGIVDGVDDLHFEPDRSITRAEFSKMLQKTFSFNESGDVKNFDDVSPESWYHESVTAITSAGIMDGYDSNFGPDNNLTREEMAKVLVSTYEKLNNKQIIDGTQSIQGDVSDWAEEYVSKCLTAGLMVGDDDGSIRPKDSVTRAEAVTVISRLKNSSK